MASDTRQTPSKSSVRSDAGSVNASTLRLKAVTSQVARAERLSSDHLYMTKQSVYRFSITAWVDADHVAYGDPEWIADAAAGALTNEYGIECVYEDIMELEEDSKG